MKIRIRHYRPGDRKVVIAAFRSNVPAYFPASEESWLRSCLDGPDGPLFVIVDDGELIGFGGYELSKFYHLGTLVFGLVRADRHGTGIGRMLLNYRLIHMAKRQLRPRYVTVDTIRIRPAFSSSADLSRLPGGPAATGPDWTGLTCVLN
jgi:GNAT superfamily N-acetyltransferase